MTPRPEITAYIRYVPLVIALHRRARQLGGSVRVHPMKLEHIHSHLRRSIILNGLCFDEAISPRAQIGTDVAIYARGI